MIKRVTLERSTFADIPQRFEAGTPAIAEAIGFGAAVTYLQGVGLEWIRDREHALTSYLLDTLSRVPGVTTYGPPDGERGGAVFLLGCRRPPA